MGYDKTLKGWHNFKPIVNYIYKSKERVNMSDKLQKLKTINDMIRAGKTVNFKTVEDLLNQVSTEEVLDLLQHVISSVIREDDSQKVEIVG